MKCAWVKLPDGGTAVVCSEGRSRSKPCSACGRPGAPLLCDGPPPPDKRRRTCDAPICRDCALEVGPDRHLCPRCRKEDEMRGGPPRSIQKVLDAAVPNRPAGPPTVACPSCGAPVYRAQFETGDSVLVDKAPNARGEFVLVLRGDSVFATSPHPDAVLPDGANRRARHVCQRPEGT